MSCLFKSVPGDFIVDEIYIDGRYVSTINSLEGQGGFLWIGLRKENLPTMDLAKLIARRIGYPIKRINYAGIKDKLSISYQIFSINLLPRTSQEHVNNILDKVSAIEGVQILFNGFNNRWIKSTDIIGNHFRIRLKDCPSFSFNLPESIYNFFGAQRFGSLKANSAEVGELLIKNKYLEALETYFDRDFKGEDPERFIKRNIKIFRFMVHAFQSKLFNEELNMRINDDNLGVLEGEYKCGVSDYGFPDLNSEGDTYVVSELIGWKLKRPNKYKLYLLDKYKVQPSDFKSLDVKGGWRTLKVPVLNSKKEFYGLDLILEFDLPKGAYATVLVNEILSKFK